VEEQKFYTGNRNMVIYFRRKNKEFKEKAITKA